MVPQVNTNCTCSSPWLIQSYTEKHVAALTRSNSV